MRVEEVEDGVDVRLELIVHLFAVLGGCADGEVHFLADEAETTNNPTGFIHVYKYSSLHTHTHVHAQTHKNTHKRTGAGTRTRTRERTQTRT